MRHDIEFIADGVTLRGWHYVPDGDGPFPTVVMAHGYAGIKELYLDDSAAFFCAAGLAAVVYDHRNFGASDGEPRQDINPWQQVEDYRHAISFARSLDSVDPDRIGIWGSSYSGGHVLMVGAVDKRVKAVVSQVPFVSGKRMLEPLVVGTESPGVLTMMLEADREAQFAGAAPIRIPVVVKDPGATCALPGREGYDFLEEARATRFPDWINEATLRSSDWSCAYEPADYAERVSPTPLLMIVASHDTLPPTETDVSLATYERALEPKKLVLLPGGHFDAYVKHFDLSAAAGRDWFLENL